MRGFGINSLWFPENKYKAVFLIDTKCFIRNMEEEKREKE
jgi:hypothetical protein